MMLKLDPAGGIRRNRWHYFLLLVVSFWLAQATRIWGAYLPGIIAVYGGDLFSGPMGIGLMGMLFPRMRVGWLWLATVALAWFLELQQLYKADWALAVRGTLFGRYFLGNAFVWSDVVCLTIGVTFTTTLEYLYYQNLKKKQRARGRKSMI